MNAAKLAELLFLNSRSFYAFCRSMPKKLDFEYAVSCHRLIIKRFLLTNKTKIHLCIHVFAALRRE